MRKRANGNIFRSAEIRLLGKQFLAAEKVILLTTGMGLLDGCSNLFVAERLKRISELSPEVWSAVDSHFS